MRERTRAYMEKAVREGKSRSGWVTQNAEFEDALMAFVDALHDPARSRDFLRELGATLEVQGGKPPYSWSVMLWSSFNVV